MRFRKVDNRLKGFWPKGLEIPILFCDIIGEEDHLQHTTSKCNIQEAHKVVSYNDNPNNTHIGIGL